MSDAYPYPFSSEHAAMLAEIRQTFGKLERGNGVTLHETPVIDDYGSQEQRRWARRKDTDRHWWEVRDEWIEAFDGLGGLSFLDAEGFRYYVPAYMSYWLKKGCEPNSLVFHLEYRGSRDIDAIFQPREKEMIARFLEYVRVSFCNKSAEKALKKVWGKYLSSGLPAQQ